MASLRIICVGLAVLIGLQSCGCTATNYAFKHLWPAHLPAEEMWPYEGPGWPGHNQVGSPEYRDPGPHDDENDGPIHDLVYWANRRPYCFV